MRKILLFTFFISGFGIFFLFQVKEAFALNHWAKDFVEGVHKNCEKKYDEKDCERSCHMLGATDDDWDVALGEKNLCIEIVCKKHANDTETAEREVYGKKYEYEKYNPCSAVCYNIKDQHYLCVKDYIKKYCQGKGYNKDKCQKYCTKGSDKDPLCPGFVTKNPPIKAPEVTEPQANEKQKVKDEIVKENQNNSFSEEQLSKEKDSSEENGSSAEGEKSVDVDDEGGGHKKNGAEIQEGANSFIEVIKRIIFWKEWLESSINKTDIDKWIGDNK